MSFFERLLSLKWYFYVFTLGTVYAIFFLIIMFPTILNPYRLPTTILLLFILSSGVITFPWIQLAWHGRFGHFTMWWLKSFGKAYVKRNREAKRAYENTPGGVKGHVIYNPITVRAEYHEHYDDTPKKEARDREKDKLAMDYTWLIALGWAKYTFEAVIILFFGFIIILFVFNKAFARAYKYGYLQKKYQERKIKGFDDVPN